VSSSADPDDTSFVYDAGGGRIRRARGDDATYYIGPVEIETDSGDVTETHSIYSLGGGVTAVRTVTSPGDDGEFTFTFGDHLGSSSTVWQAGDPGDTDPGVTSFQRYYPYGEPRDAYNPNLPTDHTFTGQISDGLLDDGGTGLMYYGARYYDPRVGRFAAADTIIPDPGNPQDLNRYAYVHNNPTNGTDPSGHDEPEDDTCSLLECRAGPLFASGGSCPHTPSILDGPDWMIIGQVTDIIVVDEHGNEVSLLEAIGAEATSIPGLLEGIASGAAEGYDILGDGRFHIVTSGPQAGLVRYNPLSEGGERSVRNALLGPTGEIAQGRLRYVRAGGVALAVVGFGLDVHESWGLYSDSGGIRQVAMAFGRGGVSAAGALGVGYMAAKGGALAGTAICGPLCGAVGGVIGATVGAVVGSGAAKWAWDHTFGAWF